MSTLSKVSIYSNSLLESLVYTFLNLNFIFSRNTSIHCFIPRGTVKCTIEHSMGLLDFGSWTFQQQADLRKSMFSTNLYVDSVFSACDDLIILEH